jgi:probable HAF family extracellular repeat protein
MPFTQTTGVNDSGTVVGWYRNNQGLLHAYWYENGTYTLFDIPGAQQTALLGIDDQGDMAGEWCSPAGRCHAFVRLANGAIRSFDFTGHPPINLAGAVTPAGDVAGTYLARVQHGYRAGAFYGFRDGRVLHSLTFPGSSETELLGMNPARVMVGSYIIQGVRHGFIATPH